jgi:hypothetical protein
MNVCETVAPEFVEQLVVVNGSCEDDPGIAGGSDVGVILALVVCAADDD